MVELSTSSLDTIDRMTGKIARSRCLQLLEFVLDDAAKSGQGGGHG